MPTVSDHAKSFYDLAAERLLSDALSNKQYHADIAYLLLHLDNQVEKLHALFSNLLAHRDQWLSHIMYAYSHHQALRDLLETSLKNMALEKLEAAHQNMPAHLRQTLLLLARHAGNYFAENNIDNTVSTCVNFNIDTLDLSALPQWIGLANLLLTQKGELRKTVDIRNGFAPKDENKSLMLATLTALTDYPKFIQALNEIQLLPPTHYSDTQWEVVTALTKLLPLLAAQLSLVFQEKNQIDFTELNIAAIRALGDDEAPTDLALYLDYQIQHLLIDEFQDTSVMHLHLLEKIIREWQPQDGRTLFLVGDPMQSVYRFRNAEVGLFLRAQKEGIGNIQLETLTLTMNFRSQAGLVNWFNHTFQSVFPTISDIATGRVPYTQAIAARDCLPDHNAKFYPIISESNEDESKKIADTLHTLRKTYPTDSIALLVQSRPQLIPIIKALQEKKLAFQAIEIEPLSQRSEIRDLLSLTRALLHRADRIAWLAILRAPFCGLLSTDLERVALFGEKITLWEALLQAEQIPDLSVDGFQRIQALRYYLLRAFQQQGQLPLSAWIEGVWLALGGPAILSHATELHYTKAYFELLEKLENNADALSIELITEQCEKLFANTSPATNNAIQILTMHKSKGLEFDHVFLPGLHRPPRNDDEKLLRWLERINSKNGYDLIMAPIKSVTQESDSIYDYLKQIENEKQNHEITRLLYVAATRAKKSLHLFAQIKWDVEKNRLKPPKKGSFLEKLWPIYETDALNWTPIQTETTTTNTTQHATYLTRHSADWFTSIAQSDIYSPKPIKIDITLHSQQSRIIGTVIHEQLQHLTETGNTKPFRSQLITLGILPHEIEPAVEIVNTAIRNTISDKQGQWILQKHHDAHCEWPFTFTDNNELKHLIIDRSFVDDNKVRWIIDYKTASPKENESLDLFLKQQKKEYSEKLQEYANALFAMENKPISIGLYFPLSQAWIEWTYQQSVSD